MAHQWKPPCTFSSTLSGSIRPGDSVPEGQSVLQYFPYAFRQLRKSPAFAAIAIITLALGIGANTAIFSLVNASLLQSLPYRSPASLVHLQETRTSEDFNQMEFSYPDFVDLRTQNHSFEAMGGYSGAAATYSGKDGAEQVPASVVSANFFDVLGVRLASGRSFQPNADAEGGERAVVLSYQSWQNRFGGDPGILGRSLKLNGELYSVVGILPRDFQFIPSRSAEIFMPLEVKGWTLRRNGHWIHPVARLKPGVTIQVAQAEVSAIYRQMEQQYPDSNKNVGAVLTPLRDQLLGPVRPVLLILFGAVAAVLLIACSNLAAMQLARSVSRRKEMAVRSALGASRRQILQLLLTESLVLAVTGGSLGLVLASTILPVLVASLPREQLAMVPFLQGLHVDARVFAFCLVASVFAGVVSGLAPALQGVRLAVADALQDGGRTTDGLLRHRLRNGLVVSQIAMAIVLLVGAGLLMKSLNKLLHVDPGFTTAHLLTFQTALPDKKYSNEASVVEFEQELRARLQVLPGVDSVATASSLPLTGAGGTSRFVLEGDPRRPEYEHEANGRDVSPNYFSTMGIPLIAGRQFDDRDKLDSPHVLIINQTLAKMLSSDSNLMGKRFDFTYTNEHRFVEIVGIVGDERVTSIDQQPTPVFYDSVAQNPNTYFGVVIRTKPNPAALSESARRVVHDIDPELPVISMTTMEQIIEESPSALMRRYPAVLIGAFAVLALVLATIGIYGLLAYVVAQRTRELGIRLALGAQRNSLLRLVIGNGMRLALMGAVIGALCSLATGRALSSLLFQVKATDLFIMTGVVTALLLVALAASYIPARRAASIEPMQALRSE
jgi:putative ABC transport system permease protein